ncbi:ABC transporter substrate-binding protein [Thauera sp. CAU 1555]|uniref:ABC transporter substrate-binding protein n=1 Tax=Thauera sedimentorum TaxID=2767595 RepID=A0ABR9BBC3_9RHOO|nr:helical backbone metal receptor [Thauera sedimentorum]MBC9072414.1 ABC transporter substrate-binding protein [Thauera sedimentorum]MBD8503333.1 ABC transporter substrate-binding protein [Thauera sedimentorum]
MNHTPTELTDALGTQHRPASGEARIVSLVPSLTELVCDMGLAANLVGRTGFCIHPRETLRAVTKVGGTKDVKLDLVRELAPTHLIVNIDENRRETVEELAAFVPHVVVTHPCTPEDNFALYRLFGALFDRRAEAERLAAELAAALTEAHAVAAALPPEDVLYLIWREPWMGVARDTYIAATLAAVGWRTLPAASDARYPQIDWQAPGLQAAARVFASTEPYRFAERHLAEIRALSGGRPASLIDGEMTSWYGSRAAAGLRYLADLRRKLVEAGTVR